MSIKEKIDNMVNELIAKVQEKDGNLEVLKDLLADSKINDNTEERLREIAKKYSIEDFDNKLTQVLEEATIKRVEKVLEVNLGEEKTFFGKIKDGFDFAKKAAEKLAEEFDRSTYGFISLNNGAGATTTAINTALELSKKYRVCILDCNFTQPSVGVTLSTPILQEKSILNYFNSSAEISDCVNDVKNNKNLWVVSTSPVDHPRDMAEIDEQLLRELLIYLEKSFQYLILDLSYDPFAEWFVFALEYADRGYFIWDEQIDNALKTKVALDYVHQLTNKANNINNVIINKRTRYTFPYPKIEEIQCNLIAEIPYLHDLVILKNEGKVYSGKDKRYNKSLEELIQDIENGQDLGGNKTC